MRPACTAASAKLACRSVGCSCSSSKLAPLRKSCAMAAVAATLVAMSSSYSASCAGSSKNPIRAPPANFSCFATSNAEAALLLSPPAAAHYVLLQTVNAGGRSAGGGEKGRARAVQVGLLPCPQLLAVALIWRQQCRQQGNLRSLLNYVQQQRPVCLEHARASYAAGPWLAGMLTNRPRLRRLRRRAWLPPLLRRGNACLLPRRMLAWLLLLLLPLPPRLLLLPLHCLPQQVLHLPRL